MEDTYYDLDSIIKDKHNNLEAIANDIHNCPVFYVTIISKYPNRISTIANYLLGKGHWYPNNKICHGKYNITHEISFYRFPQ